MMTTSRSEQTCREAFEEWWEQMHDTAELAHDSVFFKKAARIAYEAAWSRREGEVELNDGSLPFCADCRRILDSYKGPIHPDDEIPWIAKYLAFRAEVGRVRDECTEIADASPPGPVWRHEAYRDVAKALTAILEADSVTGKVGAKAATRSVAVSPDE